MIIVPSFVFMVNIEISDLGWMFLDAAEWKRQTTKASEGTCHRRDRNKTSSVTSGFTIVLHTEHGQTF